MTRQKKNGFLSKAQADRVAAHLLVRASLGAQDFDSARAILFVEGETERGVLRAHTTLEQERICVLDFGTVGIEPLLRAADARLLDWHVLVDRDEAGSHYAQSARLQLRRRAPLSHITMSEHPSFEQALWESGYRADLVAVAQEHGVEPVDDSLDSLLRLARLKLPKPLLVERAVRRAREREGATELPASMRTAIDAVRALAAQSRR